MLIDWKDIELLTYKILYEEYKDYDKSLLGEAYIAFDRARSSYDETKSAFTTYYAIKLRSHLQYYLRYNSDLIHVPLLKRDTDKVICNSIHTKINDSESTIEDMIASNAQTDCELSYKQTRDYLLNQLKTDKEKECADYILNEKTPPRDMRGAIHSPKVKMRKLLSDY